MQRDTDSPVKSETLTLPKDFSSEFFYIPRETLQLEPCLLGCAKKTDASSPKPTSFQFFRGLLPSLDFFSCYFTSLK